MSNSLSPADRKSFRIAIVCALSLEANAVLLLFDEHFDDTRYGRADGDTNSYFTGRVGEHLVVLVILPDMGNNSAASATASLRSSYTNLKFAMLVGICGGTPRIDEYDAFLGDVVVSNSVLQYDYGRQYPGQFILKSTSNDRLGRPSRDIRSLFAKLATVHQKLWIERETSINLESLQAGATLTRHWPNYQYPGIGDDKLYHPWYRHRHHTGCNICATDSNVFCDEAAKASCVELGCAPSETVARKRSEVAIKGNPFIFIGQIGSGNIVMKSGEDRDRIAVEHNLIAFEMEGAGAWDELPCIIVKGICDYSDSHKDKRWQNYAAATAASAAKAILKRYAVHDGDRTLASWNDQSISVKIRMTSSSESSRISVSDYISSQYEIKRDRQIEVDECLKRRLSKQSERRY